MAKVTVTIVIPTLNSQTTLPKLLESIRLQTYQNIEVVIVDGGSFDETETIASKSKCTFVPTHEKRSSARYLGARMAKGKFLLFVDSDQYMHKDVVADCLETAERSKSLIVKIPEEDVGEGFWFRCRRLERKLAQVEDLSYPRFFSKETYFEIGGHNTGIENYMEDRDLYLRCIDAGHTWSWIERPIFNQCGKWNPVEQAIKSSRAASDADYFYVLNYGRERVLDVVKPRIKQFFSSKELLHESLSVALFIPFYSLVIYGPRFLRAVLGRLRAFSLK